MITNDTLIDKSPIRRPSAPTTILFVLSLAGLIAFTVIDKALKSQMFADSINFSKKLQARSAHGEVPLNVLGEIITVLLVAYVILALFLRHNKMGPFLRFFTLGVIIWLNIVLRIIYADGRPSYISTELRGYDEYCESDFGNPSGHTITVVPCSLLVVVDLYEESFKRSKLGLFFALVVAAILSLAVIFIRLFLGVHAYDQLILGSLWGIFIVVTMQFIKPLMYKYVIRPILYKDEYGSQRGMVRLILIAFVILFNVPAFTAFGIRLHTHGVGSEFYNSIVNCTFIKDDYRKNFATKILAYGLAFNWILFFFLGINDSPANIRWGYRFFYERRLGKLILRAILFILINVPVIFAFIPQEDDVPGTIVRPAIILPIFGYLTGRFLVTLEKKFRLMAARPVAIPEFDENKPEADRLPIV